MANIFVGGSQRSGTSLMQQLLCQLPAANPYVYECAYLTSLVGCYGEARRHWGRNHASYFGDPEGLRGFHSLITKAFLDYTAARLGDCQHLVLKEPHLTMLWPELFELAPDSVFLLMVRDPRDVIASMVEVGQKQRAIGQQYLYVDRNIAHLCDHFLSFYGPCWDCSHPEFRRRLAVVRYEDLVGDPQGTLRQIAGFTGLPFDQIDPFQPLAAGHVNPEANANSRLYMPWVTEVSGQQVSTSRVGNHLRVLSEAEIRQVESRCRDFCEWFQYRRSSLGTSVVAPAALEVGESAPTPADATSR